VASNRRKVRQLAHAPAGGALLNAPDITTTKRLRAAPVQSVRTHSRRRRRAPHGTRIRRSYRFGSCDTVCTSAILTLAVAATYNVPLAPELAAGIARVKVSGPARSLPGFGDCAQRRSAVAALTDGRPSGGFPPEATVAARRADTAEVRYSVPDKQTSLSALTEQFARTKLDESRAMIGLKRNTLKVVDHDPDWAALAVEACQTVRNTCGGLLVDVQHVGSTAVPDLPAKPILDIAAAMVTFDSMRELLKRLAAIGYRYRGDHGYAGGHVFVVESSPEIRTIHLHVVEQSSSQWRHYVRFRDLLRHEPTIRKRYAELKRDLASICRDDREAYTASKADFIREVLDNNVNGSPVADRPA